MKSHPLPTQETLQERFYYRDGALYYRKQNRGGPKAGAMAGGVFANGRRRITVDGRTYHRSRLILVWHGIEIPEGYVVDHINGDHTDDRVENLRAVTIRENGQNLTRHRTSVIPVGVTWLRDKWSARISCPVRGLSYLGRYCNPDTAGQAYRDAAAFIDAFGELTERNRQLVRKAHEAADKLEFAKFNAKT